MTSHDHSWWLGLQPRLQCPPNSWVKDRCNSDPLSSAVGLDTGLPMLNYSGAPNNPAKANTQTQALRLMPYASFVWPFLQNQRMSYAVIMDALEVGGSSIPEIIFQKVSLKSYSIMNKYPQNLGIFVAIFPKMPLKFFSSIPYPLK